MGVFSFEIKFQPRRQSTKPKVLSQRPDLTLSNEKKLRLYSFTLETLTEISSVKNFFKDNTVPVDNTKHWFKVNIIDLSNPVECEILEILTPITKEDP